MMFGGGGSACGRADHGIGITERNNGGAFQWPGSEQDFGAWSNESSILIRIFPPKSEARALSRIEQFAFSSSLIAFCLQTNNNGK